MILEITKQRVILITMRIVWVLDVKKVVYELSGPFARVGAPQADNDSSNRSESFIKKIFLLKVLIETYYILIANYLNNVSWLYQCTHDGKTWKNVLVVLTNSAVLYKSIKFSATLVSLSFFSLFFFSIIIIQGNLFFSNKQKLYKFK